MLIIVRSFRSNNRYSAIDLGSMPVFSNTLYQIKLLCKLPKMGTGGRGKRVKRRVHHSRSHLLHQVRYFNTTQEKSSLKTSSLSKLSGHLHLALTNAKKKAGKSCNKLQVFSRSDCTLVSVNPFAQYFIVTVIPSYSQSNSSKNTHKALQGILIFLNTILTCTSVKYRQL